MEEIVSSLAHVATTIAPLSPLIGIGGTTLVASAAGVLPRAGPMRAAVIALTSRFRQRANPPTIRAEELKMLRLNMADCAYDIVTGPKGVGKSYLVLSATDNICGVVRIEALPEMDTEVIMKSALCALTNIRFGFINPGPSAQRVIFWYSLFARKPPIVVIHASERQAGSPFANISGAARILTENYGLHVLVDGSPNSLQTELFNTKRENVLEVGPLAEDVIWQLPQFKDLLDLVKDTDHKQAMWRVLGGVPADFERLLRRLKHFDSVEARRTQIEVFLCNEVGKAIRIVNAYATENPELRETLELYQKHSVVRAAWIKRPTSDKVLREVIDDGKIILVPASNAISLVLRHGITEVPNFKELLLLLSSIRDTTSPST